MEATSTRPTIKVQPQPGPQTEFFKSKADIVIYGGQAGGGKSWALVAEPLRRIKNKGYRAVMFRRTSPQLTGHGGLWDECQEIYRAFGAKLRGGAELDATFPSGAVVSFCHLQHEKNKFDHMGLQYCAEFFDELTHFSETQFFYMLSRNRSSCGIRPYIRATCNPDPASWVAGFLSWWINQETGFAIPERSGILRYFIRVQDEIVWADSKEELIEQYEGYKPDDILSVTFIPAKLDDNKILLSRDPGYKAKLKSLSKIERARLLEGNWKIAEGSQISRDDLNWYSVNEGNFEFNLTKHSFSIPMVKCRRIATIDTAGTSKEKAAEKRGKEPSWSVCGIWDIVGQYVTTANGARVVLQELVFLRHVWRARVNWTELKERVPDVLQTWNVSKAYIENAHFGQPLKTEIKGIQTELIGPVLPGMDDSSNGAKLERAIASGMLALVENRKLFLPRDDQQEKWLNDYINELTNWTGHPDEQADQIDVTSYAAHIVRKKGSSWGGVVPQNMSGRV